MNISDYLKLLNEQTMGVNPNQPVRKPQASRPTTPNQIKPKVPKQPNNPVSPQVTQQKKVPQKNMNPNQNMQQKKDEQNQKGTSKQYFNYMLWTSKILKQGEIFRKNCYGQNCSQFELGTGDRRICKDRCDIETCKKVIQLLQASVGKCSQSNNPEKCKQRYQTLIPLYRNKLNKISKKFIDAQKRKKNQEVKIG